MLTATSMLIALALDWIIGWPDALFRRIGHPVTWIGWLIADLERRLNRPPYPRRSTGVLTVVLVVGMTAGTATGLVRLLPDGVPGAILLGILAWPLVAARSMRDHVVAVLLPLKAGDLPEARRQVSMIVGRDPDMLDEAGVSRAAIESLAENTSDGIVAPLLWGVLLGLPGIAAYKAVNTLDSMIGHKNERYRDFGWAAARLDDLANLIPARLTAILFVVVSGSPGALPVILRNAGLHRSPNAGWPEAAMAGALGVRVSGPRGYGGAWTEEPWVNANAPDPTPDDLSRAISVYLRLLLGAGALLLGLAAL